MADDADVGTDVDAGRDTDARSPVVSTGGGARTDGGAAAAGPTFTDLDWDEYDGSGFLVTRTTVAFVGSLLALFALFLYDYLFVPKGLLLVGSWNPTVLDWLSLFSAIVLTFYVVVPLASSPRLTKRYGRELLAQPGAKLSLAYLGLFVLAAALGPEVWGGPENAPLWTELRVRGEPSSLPPFWDSTGMAGRNWCPTGVVDGRCHGTTIHPLGTTVRGYDVLAFLLTGARLALKVVVITAVILVPIATVVGSVAAYFGGRVDAVLMRYVDFQQAIPAFIAYFMIQFVYEASVVALVLLFGLLDWDRVARRVRNDASRRSDAGYVVAAESAGASRFDVIRRHLVPNVSGTIVAGLTTQIPFILVMEATFSYLGVVDASTDSWGSAIAAGLSAGGSFDWWAFLFPALMLVCTAYAINHLGNAIYEVLQPHQRIEE
ncbi:ABC transporter permease [Halorarum halobium]|uniref:ABC transporter permease n=1 Tax=Halorarum halobium TaxID=3075121 RepID=UPI0028AA24EC|nr:ABC transporter permease [Halobaculum sp. XH14]